MLQGLGWISCKERESKSKTDERREKAMKGRKKNGKKGDEVVKKWSVRWLCRKTHLLPRLTS